MLFVILTLLCVVASLSQAVEFVGAEYRPGRLNRRILARNDSATVVITSSLDILAPSLTTLSSEAYHGSIDAISAPTTTTTSTNDASAIEESSGDGPDLSTSDTWWTLFNLGTITTARRPTLSLPTTTPVRFTSSTSLVFIQPGVTSDASVINELPPTTSSFAFNATSRPWGWNTTSSASSLPSSTTSLPLSTTFSSSTVVTSVTPSECPARGDGRVVVTSYFITYTSTTTWSGDPGDYTPPYPSISIPTPCTPKETPTGRFTVTFCDSTGETCTFIHTTTIETSTANNLIPNPSPTTETITFTTTDKNPAVVFPTETPPSYGGPPADPPSHDTIGVGGGSVATPDYGMLTTNVDSAKSSPSPTPPAGGNSYVGGAPITVIAQPGEVIIDDHTFTDNPTHETSTVIVGTDTFVIEPSRVIGVGVTITRPPFDVGAVVTPVPAPISIPGSISIPGPSSPPGPIFPAGPITTTVGGIGVVYGPSSVATIDGTVFTIKPTPTVAVVRGQTITIGPTEIIFPSQTLHVAAGSGPTQTAVIGGELITAIGTDKVVIEGTTITYGHGSSSTITTVIDGETVLIAPTGVIVHDAVLGGVTAAPSATKYEIIGGATITQIGLTAVEISGKTFHVGLGAASTAVTTVIGGHTLTIGPKGVSMSTWTLGAPYAATTTTIIMPGSSGGSGNNNAAMTIPTATGSPDKENGASSVPRYYGLVRGLLAAVGVGCLGPLLFWL